MTDQRSILIDKILQLTKDEPTAHFDKLADKSEEYLKKLLNVIKLMKK